MKRPEGDKKYLNYLQIQRVQKFSSLEAEFRNAASLLVLAVLQSSIQLKKNHNLLFTIQTA